MSENGPGFSQPNHPRDFEAAHAALDRHLGHVDRHRRLDPVDVRRLLADAANTGIHADRHHAASAERIWRAHVGGANDPGSSALTELVVAAKSIQEVPPIHEHVIDASGGRRSHFTIAHCLTLKQREYEYDHARVIALDGNPFPFGPEHAETLTLQPQSNHTVVVMTWRSETDTLAQFLYIRHVQRRFLRRLKAYCDRTDAVSAQPS